MNLRFIILCLFAASFPVHVRSADTKQTVEIGPDGPGRTIFHPNNRTTNLLAAGDWSKPATDNHGNKLRARLLVNEGDLATNRSGQVGWQCAPVFLEIQDFAGTNKPPTQIYFDVMHGLSFELRDANGAPADKVKRGGGGSIGARPPFWTTVPPGGVLRLCAVSGLGTWSRGNTTVPKPGDLSLAFYFRPGWLIPEDDHNPYSLSVTIAPPPAGSNPYQLSQRDVINPSAICRRWQSSSDPISAFLWQTLSESDQNVIMQVRRVVPGSAPSPQAQQIVVQTFNNAINGPSIYDPARFQGIKLRSETTALLNQKPSGPGIAHLNRLLLEDAFPGELNRSPDILPLDYPAWDGTLEIPPVVLPRIKMQPGTTIY